MNNKKFLFSTGEFAKLNGVNKRTLHYYNDVGLFCPKFIDENGYHYYSCFQAIELEMILILRKVGLSVEDIKSYTNSPSQASFTQVLTEKKQIIDKFIHQLLEAKNFLQKKLDKLEMGLSAVHGQIEKIQLPERKILLSSPISGNYDEADFSIASEFSFRLKELFGLYDNFGSRIPIEDAVKGNMTGYHSFFAYGNEETDVYDDVIPAGNYLRAYCVGGWDNLKEVYERLLNYAREEKLTLYGYAYEEGLNEMSLGKDGDYITMIIVGYHQ